jgi:tripartite-type tricarboxylate transporter receptor subunit TctC
MYQKLPYDPFKDQMPVSQNHLAPLFLVVPTALQINTVAQLIEYARKNPGKVSYASAGIGSSHHLTAEQFRSLANINIVHVPYKGGAPASVALSAGEVEMGFLSYPLAVAGVQSGKTKILGIGTAQRASSFPDIPSIAESGLPGFDIYTTLGFLAPAGTPADVVFKLSEAISVAIHEPDIKELVTSYGISLAPKITPAQFGVVMRAEYEKFGQIVKSSGARMD